MITDARAHGTRVRAYGEMVALLWDLGDVSGAVELEELWNALQQDHEFDLLCAYPTSALGDARLADVSEVCALHTQVLPPSGYATGAPAADATIAEYSQVFLPVPEAVAAVRRFVTEVLTHWREVDLMSDAALVASELATNAVLHASSPFRSPWTGRSASSASPSRTPPRTRPSSRTPPTTTEAAAAWSSSRLSRVAGGPTPCRPARSSGPS